MDLFGDGDPRSDPWRGAWGIERIRAPELVQPSLPGIGGDYCRPHRRGGGAAREGATAPSPAGGALAGPARGAWWFFSPRAPPCAGAPTPPPPSGPRGAIPCPPPAPQP